MSWELVKKGPEDVAWEEAEKIKAMFLKAGFRVEDLDHFCYAWVKPLGAGYPADFVIVGKDLEEGGSELPTSFNDPVYVSFEYEGALVEELKLPSLHLLLGLVTHLAGLRKGR